MHSSARNQWPGRVGDIKEGPVTTEVSVDLDSGDTIVAVITTTSARRLGIEADRTVTLLVKASSVILASGAPVATSARNSLEGEVSAIDRGAVQAVVTLRSTHDTEVTATVTLDSVDGLGLEVGSPVTALIKASHVLVAVE